MQNITIDFNNQGGLHSIVRLLSTYRNDLDTQLDVSYSSGFVPSEIYPIICSFANEIKERGHNCQCNSTMLHNCDVSNYASRIDFFKHLDINYIELFNRRNNANRFIEITNAPKNCYGISASFTKIFCEDFGLSENDANSIGFFIDEMISNVTMHSKSESGAYFYCQKYPTKDGLEIVIVDSGIGIKSSLERINPNQSNDYYLNEAIKYGVTNGEGRGHGVVVAGAGDGAGERV